jgi:hypothetical protein
MGNFRAGELNRRAGGREKKPLGFPVLLSSRDARELAVPVLYYGLLWVSDSYLRGVLPILIVWVPNTLFLAAAVGLMPRWRREATL